VSFQQAAVAVVGEAIRRGAARALALSRRVPARQSDAAGELPAILVRCPDGGSEGDDATDVVAPPRPQIVFTMTCGNYPAAARLAQRTGILLHVVVSGAAETVNVVAEDGLRPQTLDLIEHPLEIRTLGATLPARYTLVLKPLDDLEATTGELDD